MSLPNKIYGGKCYGPFWAGNGMCFFGLIGTPKVRIWTVAKYVARPTCMFYENRNVWYSNEGSGLYPKYVALDRYNDLDWNTKKYSFGTILPCFVPSDLVMDINLDILNEVKLANKLVHEYKMNLERNR